MTSRIPRTPSDLERAGNRSLMLIETKSLPTHVARSAARLNTIGAESSGDTFLMTSYLIESAIKTIAIALQISLRQRAPTHAYRIGHELIRADGLGTWESVIRESTSEPLVGFVSHQCNELVAWATKRRSKPEDAWYKTARTATNSLLRELGNQEEASARPETVRELIAAFVRCLLYTSPSPRDS